MYQSTQAQPSHVTNTAPMGAVISHAWINFPSTYPPLHPYTLIFQTNVRVCPQILTPLSRQSGHRPRHGQIGNERVSLPTNYSAELISMTCCGESAARRLCVATATQNKPPPTFGGLAQSGAAGTVSFPTMKETLCSKNEAMSFRLLQPSLPGPQKGRDIRSNIRYYVQY